MSKSEPKEYDPNSLQDTWGSRDFIERWASRNDWQAPIRGTQMMTVDLMIPYPGDASIRILDLAAGYGALTESLLKSRPQATAVCLDVSEEMIKMGREKMKPFAARVSFGQASFEGPDWLKAVSGQFDAVVSSRALHHFSANQRRRHLYREIYGILRAGGCFINADNMKTTSSSLRARYRSARERMLDQYVREKTGGAKTLKDMQAAAPNTSHGPHDNGILEQELDWLREAGFQDVDCFWKFGTTAVYGGFR